MPTDDQVREIAERLSISEQKALRPFATFSAATGRLLVAKGLLTKEDDVFTTTPLGIAVRAYLEREGSE